MGNQDLLNNNESLLKIGESVQQYGHVGSVNSQNVQEIVMSFYVSSHAQYHAGNVDLPKVAKGLIRDESAHLCQCRVLFLRRRMVIVAIKVC